MRDLFSCRRCSYEPCNLFVGLLSPFYEAIGNMRFPRPSSYLSVAVLRFCCPLFGGIFLLSGLFSSLEVGPSFFSGADVRVSLFHGYHMLLFGVGSGDLMFFGGIIN